MSDTYNTPAQDARAEIKVKGSRFIAEVFCVESSDEAEARITAVRKREYNATHHCTAYRVGTDGSRFRYSDDGEPSGTAGAPILRQIDARALTNALVVVTRYYGGTKLGTGGLIRAYGEAASDALDGASIQEHILRDRLRLQFSYADTSPAMHTISQFDAKILEMHYTEETELVIAIRRSEAEAFLERYVDALGGRGRALSITGDDGETRPSQRSD